jgi:hypothetical protein
MAIYTIRVINKNEEPLKGVRVKVDFQELTTSNPNEVYTDADGIASLEVCGEGVGIVYLDGT